MEKCTIVKIGGDLLDHKTKFQSFLHAFSSIEGHRILIHGGGKAASRLMKDLDIPVKYHAGRRITDEASMEIVTMVYAGLINKNVVTQLHAIGVNAIGMAGCDGDMINAHKRIVVDVDYGYAGDIDHINTTLVSNLLSAGLVPTICPITHDGDGLLLNTNADTIASEMAVALSINYEVTLNYCFGIDGVLENINDPHSLIEELEEDAFLSLKAAGKISDGMIPKLTNAFTARKKGVQEITVGNHIHFTQSNGYTQII